MNHVRAILLLLMALIVPISVSAGTGRESASLASDMVKIYGEGEDTEALGLAASDAIDAGISAEFIRTFLTEAAYTGRSPVEVSSYLEIATDLHSQSIPTDIFFNSVLEGFVKGVREEEILRSIGMLRSRLLFCSEISRGHTGRGGGKGSEHELLLSALFYTMNMGFSEDEIKILSAAVEETDLTGRTFISILKVVMELSNLGLGKETVTSLMGRSIKSGVSIRQMNMFPAYVNEERAKGLTDDIIYSLLLQKADEALLSERSPENTGRDYSTGGARTGGKGEPTGGGSSTAGGSGHGRGK
jgi:hypothetical protein